MVGLGGRQRGRGLKTSKERKVGLVSFFLSEGKEDEIGEDGPEVGLRGKEGFREGEKRERREREKHDVRCRIPASFHPLDSTRLRR